MTTAMKNALQSVVEVDGKKYSLATFDIMTSKDYTEKGLLHIYGDKDDPTYSDLRTAGLLHRRSESGLPAGQEKRL